MSAREDIKRAAAALTDQGQVPFSPIELIGEARKLGCLYRDPTLRTHIVNYMCINAGGESAGMYPDLLRVSRGLYRLADGSSAVVPAPSIVPVGSIPRRRITRTDIARKNVDALIASFNDSLRTFEQVEIFGGPSLYFHLRALERREQASSAATLLHDNRFLEYVYAVLPSWGMHRMGKQAAKVPDFDVFSQSLQACTADISQLWALDITAIDKADTQELGEELWSIIARLRASTSKAQLVSGSKTLHHVLPSLMPPIDRQYTYSFFGGLAAVKEAEKVAFGEWWPLLCEIGRTCSAEINLAAGRPERMATSTSKVIDNAIIGYMRGHR